MFLWIAQANCLLLAQTGSATINAPRGLITQVVDETQLTTLKANTHPLARPEFDLGTAPATLALSRMLLVLKRSPEQEVALEQRLDDQQNKSSVNYHKWLTPEEFGAQFGPADGDMATIKTWLQSHGFQVGSTNGRTVLEFSGSASQVQEAFHTTIHKYIVNGEQHWANATDPQIPTALTSAVAGIVSLNNFPRKPMNAPGGTFTRSSKTGKIGTAHPLLTFPGGCVENNSEDGYCEYGLGPYDFATIYNVLPLWNAGIDGTGVTIAIVGETDIQMSDVQAFRSFFGLPANDPTFIWNGPDPGIQGDEPEADIDVQWSGGVAKGASIDFVISQSTETTFGTDLSAVYIVDQNLAPIMSESYGQCELVLGTAGNQFYNSLWQQASAQGITVFISAGDAGSAGCDNFDAQPPAPAEFGLQVSGYASTPYNVAVGGTDFNDFNNPATYWSITNNPTTQESALGYIPETTWNDSCTNAIWEMFQGLSTNPETNCNNPELNDVIPEGGSGGVSACTTPTGSTPQNCSGGYAKPSWQTGSGVPADGKRDLPDVSLFASNGFVGQAYIICEADQNGDCPSQFLGFGGTSVSSPAFAGIMALINQKTGERQGNANYVFYKLASRSGSSCTSASNESTSCIFNDVTQGTIAMPCASGSPNCVTSFGGDSYGILSGYNAAAGYDQATGLGSVNANNLVNQWSSVASLPSVTTLSSLTPTTITHGQSVNFTVTVKPESGTGTTPTGTISLAGPTTANNTSQGIAGFNLSSGTVTGNTDMLPGGTYSVTAHYPGDSNYAPSDSSGISVTVGKENSQPQAFLVTFNANNTVISSNTNTAVYGSPYILRVNVDNSAGQMCAPTAASGATACPSGNVTITDNGAALDAGTYALNSYGYFEDYTVQLPGGTNSVKAAYAGDSSFNASTATNSIAITPAVSELNAPTVQNTYVGAAFTASATVQSQSSGAAPTGTITILSNGSPVTGTTSYQSGTGSGSNPVAYLTANFISSTSAFPVSGSYSITASYNGDGNYTSVTSSPTQFTVQYPTPYVAVTPYQQNVAIGARANLSVQIDSANKTIHPTGTVLFTNAQNGAILAGPVTCASTIDGDGDYACTASTSFVVTTGITVLIGYSGDTNYPATSSSALVVANDFQIGIDSSTIVKATQGQPQTAQLDIEYLGAFNGTVGNFTCAGLPAETTCSFNPTQLTTSGSTIVTITTTSPGQSGQFRRTANEKTRIGWMASTMFPLIGVCFVGMAVRQRRSLLPFLTMLVLLAIVVSCGGGGGSGGGGGQQSNPVPSVSSLSPTQQTAGSQSQTLTINGSNFVQGSAITYNGAAHAAAYVNTSQLTTSLSANDLATVGSYPVVVTNPSPGGGASNSTDFNVVTTGTPTGSYTVSVGASSGSISHITTFTLIVQ